MGAAPGSLRLALLALAAAAPLAGCETPAPAAPAERAAPRNLIQPYAAPARTGPVSSAGGDPGRLTPGPNSRISPTPDMAPRVQPAPRVEVPSSRPEVEDLSRRLQQQRRWEPEKPGVPIGTIDQRPGTIRTSPGTIEVPR